jgi:hypothetical protein
VIAPSETDQTSFMEVTQEFPDIHVRVNMEATCLLNQDMSAIMKEADRAISIAQSRQNTSVGCGVIPFETNPETILKIRKHVAG